MRAVVLYIILVSIPILGILGILQIGQNLTAPISLHGTWNVALDPQYATDPACITPLDVGNQRVLTISQSGSQLVLTFNDANATTLSGIIEGQAMIANSANTIAIRTSANQLKVPDQLQGDFTFPSCQSRMPVPFIATLQQATGTKAEGH